MAARSIAATVPLLNRLLGTTFTSAPGETGSGALVRATGGTLTGPIFDVVAFASLPAAASSTGRVYRVSDVGGGSLMQSNGTIWVPLNGIAILSTSGTNAGSVATTEAAGIQQFVDLPAGLLGTKGAIELDLLLDAKSSTQAVNLAIRLFAGSGAGATGTAFISTTNTANNTVWSKFRFMNTGAANAQSGTTNISNSDGTTSNGFGTASIDTSAASVLRWNAWVAAGNGTTDTVNLRGHVCRLISV